MKADAGNHSVTACVTAPHFSGILMLNRSSIAILMLLAIVVAACSATGPSSTPPPSPSPRGPLPIAELRYRLIDELGPLWYCDRDFYPIARDDEGVLAIQRFGEVQADREAFAAILGHLGLGAGAAFSADQKLAIYRAWKQLNAIVLDPVGDGSYRFDYLTMPAQGANDGRRTTGTIDVSGTIAIDQQQPAGAPPCPICLARGTRIATPDGDVAIEDIRVGMRVWSIDEAGRRVVERVVRIGQTPVPDAHQVVRLVLDDGRVVRASPGHPLADGRRLGTMQAGDWVDGATVISATLERYQGGSTFDLLPDGPTGVYIADGVPLGSTLAGE
jgi:hypothetical protein